MIQANELRIGNLITHGSDVLTVEQIGTKASFRDEYRVIQFVEDKTTLAFIKDCDPIPLTPEILERLGFDKSLRLDIGDFSYRYYSGKGVNVSFKEWPDVANATYLHELQNLYFALTSHELTLTDKK